MNLLREKLRARGVHVLRCSDSPDVSGINRAAEDNAQLGKDALAWYKSAYEDQKPLREEAARRASEVSDAQLRAMDTQTALALDRSNYERTTLRPLQQSIVDDANKYDTEAERERLAGLALGDVRQAGAAARDIGLRDMTRHGVNPADGRFAGMNERIAMGETLAGADAMNKARTQATTIGRAMKMDAASMLSGLPGQQATNAQIALSAGNSGANNGQVPVQIAQQGTQMAGQGFQTAIQGNSSAGNLYGQAAQIGSQGNSDLSNLAAIGMTGAKLFTMSDENQKEDIKPANDEIALAAVRKMPVKKWKYRPDSPAADGGQEHTGPMAQDVHAALGERVAPGGKQVDLISLAGTTLSAVKALDKKVDRIALKRTERSTHGKR